MIFTNHMSTYFILSPGFPLPTFLSMAWGCYREDFPNKTNLNDWIPMEYEYH